MARYWTRCLHNLRPVCTVSPQRTKKTRTARMRTARMRTARMRTASRKATMMMLTVAAGNVRPVTGIWLLLSSAKGVSATRNARVVSQGVQRRRLRPTAPGHRLVRTPRARGLASVSSHSLSTPSYAQVRTAVFQSASASRQNLLLQAQRSKGFQVMRDRE